jgi:hypothetical protein
MNRPLLAALLLAGAPALALAQQPAEIPKHKCEPKPVLPGPRMMEEARVRKTFQNDVETYKKCMKAYADDRAAAAQGAHRRRQRGDQRVQRHHEGAAGCPGGALIQPKKGPMT